MPTNAAASAPRVHPKYENGERMAAEITELYAYLSAATCRFLALVREFDRQGYWQLPGLTSCAHWLNFRCGIGMNAAREKVRVAHALAGLPKIGASFAKGEISYSKVRAMTRIATPENEDYLLMIARHGTAYHTEKLVAGYRRAVRLKDAAYAAAQRQNRHVSTRWDDDGCLVVTARLPAEQGALLLKALEHAAEKQWQEQKAAADVSAETPPERESLAVRRADALAEVAEVYLAADTTTSSSADRYQVLLHVTAETSRLDEGPGVAADTSRRIACDSAVVPVFMSRDGEPLSIGRKSRTIPPALRRALNIRDGGCRFPGCTQTRFVDGHHVVHWANGGTTCLDNLVLLCRRHHRLVHEGGYGCEHATTGKVVFKSPRGNVLPERPDALPAITCESPMQWLDTRIDTGHITADTCVTRWTGERIDWALAVGHLFH